MIIHRTIQHPGVIILTDLGHQYMYNINYLCTKYYKYSSKDVKNTCVKDAPSFYYLVVRLYSSCICNAGMVPSSATVGVNMYIYTVKGLYKYFPQYHHWF